MALDRGPEIAAAQTFTRLVVVNGAVQTDRLALNAVGHSFQVAACVIPIFPVDGPLLIWAVNRL